MWSLFFLIVTGRALENDDLAADEYEQVFDFMYELSKTAPFAIKTTEAMHYRRYVAQRMKAEHRSMPESEKAGAVMWRTAGVSDGKGFVFVSHTGEIFPERLPADHRRQRAAGFADRRVSEFEPVPLAARRRASAKASAASASIRRCAAARAPAPMR